MAIKAKLTQAEFQSLPAQIPKEQAFKADASGHYLADIDAVDGLILDNPSVTRTALEAERTARQQLETNLRAFEGLNPAEARTALTEVPILRNQLANHKDGIPKATVDQQIQTITAKHTESEQAWKTRESKLVGTIAEAVRDAEATAIMADPNIKGNPALLLPIIQSSVRVVETKDGKWRTSIIDPRTGAERLTTSKDKQPTDPMDLREFILELKGNSKYTGAFGGSESRGTGASSSHQGAGSSSGDIVLSSEDARNAVKYQEARKEADKRGVNVVIQ